MFAAFISLNSEVQNDFNSTLQKMATLFTKSAPAVTRSGDGVYVAAVPLRATKGPAQLLASAAYSFNIWDFQHFMVIIAPPSSPSSHSQVLFFSNFVLLFLFLPTFNLWGSYKGFCLHTPWGMSNFLPNLLLNWVDWLPFLVVRDDFRH